MPKKKSAKRKKSAKSAKKKGHPSAGKSEKKTANGKALMPQPHGGALQRGGPGRPSSKVREMAREMFWRCLPEIEPIAANKPDTEGVECPNCGHQVVKPTGKRPYRVDEQTRALDLMAKYGIGTRQELTGANGEPIAVAALAHPSHIPES